jgi:NAD+-dependent secondary alcohol dehydrogenase Adh1
MKAVRLHEYKKSPSLDEVPQPDLEGPHDVIVRIGGAGVCRTDLHLIDGWFAELLPAEVPFTLGHENAGWVEAVGDAVTSTKAGDSVIVHPLRTCGVCWGCRHGEDMYCAAGLFPGVNVDGGYAEYLRTHERSIVVLPEGTKPAEVAPHADAGLTAYRAVRKAAAILQPGQTAVVIGVGGLGHIAIQLLHEMTPALVAAIDPAQRGRDLAATTGAEAILDSAGAAEAVAELTGGVGADVVIDFVGEHGTPAQAVGMLKQGGTYLAVGYGGELKLPTIELVLKEITVTGNLVGNYGDLSDLMKLVADGAVKLETRTYPLEEALNALDDLDNGRIKGRGVLVPSEG